MGRGMCAPYDAVERHIERAIDALVGSTCVPEAAACEDSLREALMWVRRLGASPWTTLGATAGRSGATRAGIASARSAGERS